MTETIKKQLIFLIGTACLFLICLLGILFFVDPFHASIVTLVLLYVCLSFFCICSISAIFYFSRAVYFSKRYGLVNIGKNKLAVSVRQSILFTVLVVVSLILSSKGFLFWWIELSLFITILLIEIFFLV